MRRSLTLISCLVLLLAACDNASNTVDVTDEARQTRAVAPSEQPEAEKRFEASNNSPTAAHSAGEALESHTGQIDGARDGVTPHAHDGAPNGEVADGETTALSAPDGEDAADVSVRVIPFDAQKFPGDLPIGRVDGGVAFIDSAGVNHVVFTLDAPAKRGHIRRTTLHVKHLAEKDGIAHEVRRYIERIADCDFDVVVKPYYGEWSVSDVNNNGIGEVSFAYSADCVADISPFAHKAFITEAGEKYALRGYTLRQFPNGSSVGGSYTADTMPPLFLEKVTQVWNRTAPH